MKNWKNKTPDKPGFYWCCRNGNICMVNVWEYTDPKDKRLFTNEDGGALVSDRELYNKAMWSGPIEPPPKPTI